VEEERSDVLHRVGTAYLYTLHNVHRPCLVGLGALRTHVTQWRQPLRHHQSRYLGC